VPLFKSQKSDSPRRRLFFATDVHASQKTFEKFLSAATYYKVDALILGGDLTGKFLAPIIEQSDGTYFTDFQGNSITIKNGEQLRKLEEDIRTTGYYTFHTTKREYEEIRNDKTKIDQLFEKLMLVTLEQWVNLSEETLKKAGINCYITGGNDDPFAIDAFMRSHNTEHVMYCEGQVVDVNGYELAGLGYSNMTPWRLPRDLDEVKLEVAIEKVVSKIQNNNKAIFAIHVPPYDTGLDLAIWLDEKLKYQHYGQPIEGPVGSHAVFKLLDKYQPLLSLHGHIHESRCFYKLGRTICFNPGSEYSEGILRGVIINLRDGKVESYQFTSG
jgi:Icc-related predicted phosphoesterase